MTSNSLPLPTLLYHSQPLTAQNSPLLAALHSLSLYCRMYYWPLIRSPWPFWLQAARLALSLGQASALSRPPLPHLLTLLLTALASFFSPLGVWVLCLGSPHSRGSGVVSWPAWVAGLAETPGFAGTPSPTRGPQESPLQPSLTSPSPPSPSRLRFVRHLSASSPVSILVASAVGSVAGL